MLTLQDLLSLAAVALPGAVLITIAERFFS